MTSPWQTSVPRQGPEGGADLDTFAERVLTAGPTRSASELRAPSRRRYRTRPGQPDAGGWVAWEVVVSSAAASQLSPDALGPAVGEGILLQGEPQAEGSRVPSLPSPYENNAGLLLAERARRFPVSGGEQAEHRPVAIGFVQVPGLDASVHARGGAAAALVLGPLIRSADAAGVNVERCELLLAKAGVLQREWRQGDYPSQRRVSVTMSSVLDN